MISFILDLSTLTISGFTYDSTNNYLIKDFRTTDYVVIPNIENYKYIKVDMSTQFNNYAMSRNIFKIPIEENSSYNYIDIKSGGITEPYYPDLNFRSLIKIYLTNFENKKQNGLAKC